MYYYKERWIRGTLCCSRGPTDEFHPLLYSTKSAAVDRTDCLTQESTGECAYIIRDVYIPESIGSKVQYQIDRIPRFDKGEAIMFYEESWNNNVLYYRTNPNGNWRMRLFGNKQEVGDKCASLYRNCTSENMYNSKLVSRPTNPKQKAYIVVRKKVVRSGDPELITKKETVNHPDHYNSNPSGVECIDVVEHMNFNCGNAVKYIWRAGDKGKLIEDLKKAEWYIRREIERVYKELNPVQPKEEK